MWSQCSHQSGLQCLSSLLHTLSCKCKDNEHPCLTIMPLYCIYLVLYSRSKDGEELLLLSDKSSVVRLLYSPPISRRPSGESQLTWPYLLLLKCCCCSWWLVLQPEPLREMQLVPAAVEPNPPHATFPSWVWYILPAGRGGTEHEWGTPEGVSTSTDAR